MQSGNGVDLPTIYQLLTQVAQRVVAIETRLDDHTSKLNELTAAVNGHRRTLDELVTIANEHSRKIDIVSAGLRELRSTVFQYHESVVSHGVSLTRLEERVRRIEQELNIGPAAG